MSAVRPVSSSPALLADPERIVAIPEYCTSLLISILEVTCQLIKTFSKGKSEWHNRKGRPQQQIPAPGAGGCTTEAAVGSLHEHAVPPLQGR